MSLHKQAPGPKYHFALGNITEFKQNSLACMVDWQQQYGDLVKFRLGTRNIYLLSHPNLVEQALIQQQDVFVKMYDPQKPKGLALVLGQGLVTSQGDLWRRQRRLMQPVFQRSNVGLMLPQMMQAVHHLFQRWDVLAANQSINIAQEMMQLTLEVITQTMFSTSVLYQIEQISPALETGLRFAAKTAMNPLTLPLWFPSQSNGNFKQALNTLDTVIFDLIQQRRLSGQQNNDLLDMLLAATDPETGNKMDDQQIRDEVITIFSAGHETTANTLTWTLYLLVKHPAVLNRVRQELTDNLDADVVTAEDLKKLVYSRAVLEESMRIRPAVGFVMRKIAKDTQLNGYALAKSGLAIMNIYNIHHHPDLWDQPEVFNPDRFLNKASRRFSYMPFGAGPRVCIGNHFAMAESLLLMTQIVKHFDLQLTDSREPEMEMMVTIRPKGGINMQIKRR